MMELEQLLHKYLNGNAKAADIERLKANLEYNAQLKIADASAQLQVPEFDATNTLKGIQKEVQQGPKVRQINPLRNLLKIAALVAIVITGFVLISSLDIKISTDIAEQQDILLPNASEVILNANSELSYNKKNWDDTRVLNLKGEAYFKVTKGNTFSVNTNQGTVTVLGTEFNVFARDTIFNVVCYEGLVRVDFNGQTIKLPAGNKLKIENNKLILNTGSAAAIPVWIGNESSFDNDALSAVFMAIEAQYPVRITAPNYINAKRFSGSFTHTNLENALRAICAPLQLEFTIDGDQVRIYAKGQK